MRFDCKIVALLFCLSLSFFCSGCFESSKELSEKGAKMVNLRRDFKAGKELFLQAIEKDPKNAKAHKNVAYCFAKENKPDKAIKHLKKAVEIDPNYGGAHINLSLLYFLQKDYEGAVKHCDLAVEAGFPVDMKYRNKLQKYR